MITMWQFLVWKDPMPRTLSQIHVGLEEPAVYIV